jgi:hypothetical protein
VRLLIRALTAVGLTLVAAATLALPAGAANKKVGPSQYFTGVINGTNGNTANPITIQVVCAGPLRSGQTGHPVNGQTLAVHELFPPSSATGSVGKTGTGSRIEVFFTTPPPAAAARKAKSAAVVFTRYDKPQSLPASLNLPCSGTGNVWFSPIPVVPPSQSATVPVQYENIAV